MDPNRLEETVKTHENALYRAALAILGDAQEAQDAVQDAFLRYLEKAPDFASPEHEKAWLLRVAINESRDLLRDAFRSRSAPWEEVLSQQGQPVEEEYRELLRAVLSLPPKYRDAVYLYYYEGYRAAEIGKLLGKNVNTVYTLLERSRKLLRDQLEGGGSHG